MFDHDRILLFDFETTGLNPMHDQIIEIGAIVLEKKDGGYVVTNEMQELVMADRPLPPKITDITHITDEMLLREGIPQEEACHKLLDLYQDEKTLLIAYNIQFDIGFLTSLFRKYWNQSFWIKNDLLDVMAVYKDRHSYPHRLESAVATYQVEEPNTHRALDDIKATLEVLKRMNDSKPNIKYYVNKIGFNPKYNLSGIKLPHVTYVAQYGGRGEIERLFNL